MNHPNENDSSFRPTLASSGRGCAARVLAGLSRRVYGFQSDSAFRRRAAEAYRWAEATGAAHMTQAQ